MPTYRSGYHVSYDTLSRWKRYKAFREAQIRYSYTLRGIGVVTVVATVCVYVAKWRGWLCSA